MATNWVSTVRLFTFVITVLVSIAVIFLNANFISWTYYDYTFPTVALVTSPLTFLTITSMLIIDHFRKGSIFLYTSVEIAWLLVLSILWLITGSYTAWDDSEFTNDHYYTNYYYYGHPSGCNYGDYSASYSYGKPVTRLCYELKVTMAFSFFLGALLIGYTIILLVLNHRANGRGHSAWKTSVRDGVLLYPAYATESTAQVPAAQPTAVPPPNPHAPATQITSVPQSYVPATQITIVPQPYSQVPAAPTTIITPSYDPARQHSLPISVSYLSPSVPEV